MPLIILPMPHIILSIHEWFCKYYIANWTQQKLARRAQFLPMLWWKRGISVVPVGPGQVLNRSWFSPGLVSVLTQTIPKPVSLHPHSGSEHSSIMLRTFLNNAQNIPGSGPEQSWFWSRTVLDQVPSSPNTCIEQYLWHVPDLPAGSFLKWVLFIPGTYLEQGGRFFQLRFLLNTIETGSYAWVGRYCTTQEPF